LISSSIKGEIKVWQYKEKLLIHSLDRTFYSLLYSMVVNTIDKEIVAVGSDSIGTTIKVFHFPVEIYPDTKALDNNENSLFQNFEMWSKSLKRNPI